MSHLICAVVGAIVGGLGGMFCFALLMDGRHSDDLRDAHQRGLETGRRGDGV